VRKLKISLMAAFLFALVMQINGRASDQIDIEDIQVTAIQSTDSPNQCALILDFQYPNHLDSSEIVFAELRAVISYQLADGLPLTLACAPILRGEQLRNRTFDYIRDNFSTIIDRTVFTTGFLGETSNDTVYFDISRAFKKWVEDRSQFNGLLIVPLEEHSEFYGLVQNDPLLEIKIDYAERDID
jgi:hypothetical protein